MRHFIIYLNTCVFWPCKLEKINYLSHGAKIMGDNIGKVVYRTLTYKGDSLTTLYHHVDLKHSIISRKQCGCEFKEILYKICEKLSQGRSWQSFMKI